MSATPKDATAKTVLALNKMRGGDPPSHRRFQTKSESRSAGPRLLSPHWSRKILNNSRFLIAALILAAAILIPAVLRHKNLTCKVPYRDDVTIRIGEQKLKAEVAKSSEQLTKGLGGRDCMNPDQAMLFEFGSAGHYPFWMKDMRFAIDIVWLNSNHQVVYKKSNISPASYPKTFTNNLPAQYVLEILAGRAQQLGITGGTLVDF